MTEMPLLIFTLIEQTTVGAFAALVIMHFMGKAKVGKTAFVTAAVLFVLAVAGMAASMTHRKGPGIFTGDKPQRAILPAQQAQVPQRR